MKVKKFILIPHADFSGPTGGVQESCKNLMSFGKPYTQWTLVSPHPVPKNVCKDSIFIPASDKSTFSIHSVPSKQESKSVVKQIINRKPDFIIFTNIIPTTAALFPYFPENLKSKTYILWRSLLMPRLVECYPNLNKWIKTQMEFAHQVKMNLAISKTTANSLLNKGLDSNKMRVIGNQIGGEFTPKLRIKNGDKIRKEWLASDELGVGIVSRVSTNKGLEWLPKYYDFLRRRIGHVPPNTKYKKIKISWVGSIKDTFRPLLNQLLKEIQTSTKRTQKLPGAKRVSFQFLGDINRERIASFYSAYDVFLMPSPYEGFGRVTVEAGSSGMVVIGNKNCEVTEEILTEAPYPIGMLAETAIEAAKLTLKLFKNNSPLEQLKGNAIKWFPNRYTLKKAEDMFWSALDI